MRWKKIAVIFGVIFLGLIATSLIVLFSYDYNKFKPYITQAAKEATGRDLTLAGDLKLKLGFTPALVIENISFQNAPWGSRPEMAKVKRFELEVALLPLISRNIQINRFRLVEPDILLEINKVGVSNLTFAGKREAKSDQKKTAEKSALPAFLVRELLIEKGHLTYRDARSEKSYSLGLDQFSITMDSDKPIEIRGKGVYNKTPFDMAAKLGSITALTNPSGEWPLTLKVEAVETNLSFDGTIRDVLAAQGIKVKFEVKSRDLTKLTPLVGAPIPIKGPLEISGQMADVAPHVYKISNLKMILDKSDLEGGAELNLAGTRPKLSGTFSSRLLDLKGLMPPKTGEGGKAVKAGKISPKAERVFPNDPLPLNLLKAADVDVGVTAEKVLAPRWVLDKARFEARLKDGSLVLKPIQALIGGGSLDGSVNIRAEGNEGALISAFKIDRLDVGSLLKEFGITDLFEGKVDMILDLQGKGSTVAALMAGLSGKTQIIMNKGRIDQKYIGLLGSGVATDLLRILNPLKQQMKDVELNCFFSFFDIKNGLAKSTALALDTNYITVVGEGTVNLKTEELNFAFNPVTKSSLGSKGGVDLSLGDLSKPLQLTGTLAKPELHVSAAESALAVGKLVGGDLANLVTGSLIKVGPKAEQDFCLTAIETAKRGGKEGPKKEKGEAPKASEGSKGAAEETVNTFKKIFGK
jgi:AsmA family protein